MNLMTGGAKPSAGWNVHVAAAGEIVVAAGAQSASSGYEGELVLVGLGRPVTGIAGGR